MEQKSFFWYKGFYPHTLSINNLKKKSRRPNICFRKQKQIFGAPDFIFLNYWSKKNVKKIFCIKQVLEGFLSEAHEYQNLLKVSE